MTRTGFVQLVIVEMTLRWKYSDADFTLRQLADTIAWLIESDADFDLLETEDLDTNPKMKGAH